MHLCIIVFYRTKNAPHPQVAKIWWIFCGGPFRSGKYTIECKFAGVTHVIYCFTVVIQGSQVTRKQRFPMHQNTVLLPNNTKLTDDIQERWSHHQITFKSLWMYVNKKKSMELEPGMQPSNYFDLFWKTSDQYILWTHSVCLHCDDMACLFNVQESTAIYYINC